MLSLVSQLLTAVALVKSCPSSAAPTRVKAQILYLVLSLAVIILLDIIYFGYLLQYPPPPLLLVTDLVGGSILPTTPTGHRHRVHRVMALSAF